jgi:hypothetical protein
MSSFKEPHAEQYKWNNGDQYRRCGNISCSKFLIYAEDESIKVNSKNFQNLLFHACNTPWFFSDLAARWYHEQGEDYIGNQRFWVDIEMCVEKETERNEQALTGIHPQNTL